MSKFQWIICFTGHRNKMSDNASLLEIWLSNRQAKWIHGGAEGFDTQVQKFIEYHGIDHQIFPPEYEKYPDNPKYAPLARNFQMVDMCDLVVACYDRRKSGGTFRTVEYAMQVGRPIKYTKVYPLRKGHSF